MFLLFIRVLLFIFSIKTVSSLPCLARSYGKDSFVCVCDAYYCDEFTDIPTKEAGSAVMFVTNRDKHRFKEYRLKMKKKSNQNDNRTLLKILSKSNLTQINRKIIGFGGAFTDATGINVYKLERSLALKIVNNYFGNKGLRYSIGRVPIAGTDFSTRPYTYDDIDPNSEDFDLKYFKLAPEDIQYKIPLIQKANKLVPSLKLFASSWSAPKWMKTNRNLTGKGEIRGDVIDKFYKTWANYFIKFLKEYSLRKINFWGLTIQNEPYDGTLPNFPFNCMAMSPEKQRDFIKFDLWPALIVNNFTNIKLMIADDQRPFIQKYADVILKDKQAAKFVSGVAFHWYMNPYSSPEILNNITNDFQDHFLLSTEACEGSNPFDTEKVILGSWQRAENYAYDIIQDLQHTTSGWVDWNMVLDLEGGPNWVKNFVDSPIIVNSTAGQYYKQPMFYILGHFSRFLPPGSLRLDSKIINQFGDNNAVIEAVFFSTDNGKTTVAILLNRFESSIPVRIKDTNNPAIVLDFEMQPKSIATVQW